MWNVLSSEFIQILVDLGDKKVHSLLKENIYFNPTLMGMRNLYTAKASLLQCLKVCQVILHMSKIGNLKSMHRF